MDDLTKDKILDEYVSHLQHDYNNLKKMSKFIIIENEQYKAIIDDTLKILEKKINDITHSKSFKDVKKHVKLKKLLKDKEGKYGR